MNAGRNKSYAKSCLVCGSFEDAHKCPYLAVETPICDITALFWLVIWDQVMKKWTR